MRAPRRAHRSLERRLCCADGGGDLRLSVNGSANASEDLSGVSYWRHFTASRSAGRPSARALYQEIKSPGLNDAEISGSRYVGPPLGTVPLTEPNFEFTRRDRPLCAATG